MTWRWITDPTDRPDTLVTITVDGQALAVPGGVPLAACLLALGRRTLGHDPGGRPLGPGCLIGTCHGCTVRVGADLRRACQVLTVEGLLVTTASAPPAPNDSRGTQGKYG
ncbi:MAG: 2Fe-2S iron-sulfur cluster-binding protein [Alphaproteobacteria bacterium]|nr:2Fe-2S iron-sulfur cluster-binding protein [Alphaproteobacteria bacterium]